MKGKQLENEARIETTTKNYAEIPITKKSIEKIKGYARIADGSEVYGFLLAPVTAKDGVIRDVILAQNQEASGGHAKIEAIAAGESKAEIENMGYKALGFWHSHGSLPAFHSGTDDHNLEMLLSSFAGNNEERFTKSKKNIRYVDYQESKITFRGDGYEISLHLDQRDVSYESKFKGENYLVLAGDASTRLLAALTSDFNFLIRDGPGVIIAREPRIIEIKKDIEQECIVSGVAYSIVVNSRGELYNEMAINKWCTTCEREETKIKKNIPFNTIESDEPAIDEASLQKDIEARVNNLRFGGKKPWSTKKDTIVRL